MPSIATLSSTDAAARGTDVAREIVRQLGGRVLMGMGYRQAMSLADCAEHRGGIAFRVGSGNPRRTVTITLAGNDTYTVEFGRTTRGVYRHEDTATGIYADQLAEHLLSTHGRVTHPGSY